MGVAPRSQAMRLRIKVFLGVLLISLAVGLAVNFSRSAIYQASARVQITPPGKPANPEAPSDAMGDEARQALLVEMEVLASRPLLEQAAERLRAQGLLPAAPGDPVLALRSMLQLSRVEDTPIVKLQAQGTRQDLVAPLLNTLLEVYHAQQAVAGISSSQVQLDAAQDEVKVIDAKVAEKRRALENLRLRANIVSGERDENPTLSRLKGLSKSLSAATDREAAAAGALRALEQAVAAGKRAPTAKDSPTAASIESRLSLMKEEWRALERQFTPAYLAMDPNTRSLKNRIGDLEQQLESERQRSHQTALADAREELAAAQAAAQRLQQQLGSDKQEVNSFSRSFAQFQSLQGEIKSLELVSQSAREKLLAWQASDTARQPRLLVLEPAVTPDTPWQPQYWRDAGICALAALVLSFLSVWFVEFFNRKEPPAPAPPTVVVPQPWMLDIQALGLPHQAAPRAEQQLLASPLPRELEPGEVAQLLRAAAPQNLPVLACLLCGLSPEEVVSLQQQHLDIEHKLLRVPGNASRVLPLAAQLRPLAEQALSNSKPQSHLFTDGAGSPLEPQDIDAIVTSSAFDADLTQAQSVTPAALRHTYMAFLLRQGLRFSELGQLAGRLSTEALHSLAPLAQETSKGQRVGMAQVQQLLPGLQL